MPTLTVKLPHELHTRLVHEANRTALSKSQIVRKALEHYFEIVDIGGKPSAYKAMKPGIGCIHSGVGVLSTNLKHMGSFIQTVSTCESIRSNFDAA